MIVVDGALWARRVGGAAIDGRRDIRRGLGDIELLAPDLDELGADGAVLAEPGVLLLDGRAGEFLAGLLGVLLGRGREEVAPSGPQLGRLGFAEREAAVHFPAFIGDERLDLSLALDDETHRDRLDASGAEAPRDLLPQQGADLVAHDAVEDPPRLLGVDAVDIDRVGVAEGAGDLVLGDRGEDDPLGVGRLDADLLGEVPRDRLPLAVEVGCEPDLAAGAHRVLGGPFEVLDHALLAAEHLVLGLEAFLDVYAGDGALDALGILAGQVADMPDAREDDIVVAQVLVDRLRLRGALDDHQALAFRLARLVGLLLLAARATARRLARRRTARRPARGLLGGLLFGRRLLRHRQPVSAARRSTLDKAERLSIEPAVPASSAESRAHGDRSEREIGPLVKA